MPFYDRKCVACDWIAIDVFEPVHLEPPPCPDCGSVTERAWITKPSNVIGDECDFIQHNGTKTPIRFRSRAEFRRWLKQEGYSINDTHVPLSGSDKSPHSTNWAQGCDPQTLENARILAERAFQGRSRRSDDDSVDEMHIEWHTGTYNPKTNTFHE